MSNNINKSGAPATALNAPQKKRLNVKNISFILAICLFVLFFVISAVTYYDRNYLTLQNFINLFFDNSFLIIAATGMTYVILTGGIDISIASTMALVSMLSAYLMNGGVQKKDELFASWSSGAVIPLMIVIGLAVGTFMGILIQYFNFQPFIATLAGQFLCRGLIYTFSTRAINIGDPFYVNASAAKIVLSDDAFLPLIVIFALLLVVISWFVLKYTKFGRTVYAIGGNEQSAILMGLPVARTKVLVYTINGGFAALAGIVFSIYTLSGNPLQNIGLELDAIASCVIGGTLLTGGFGTVFGALFGVLIQGVIQIFIIFNGSLSSWWTKVTFAAILSLFIIMQRLFAMRAEKNKGMSA